MQRLRKQCVVVQRGCKALQLLLPDERAADAWVRRPNLAPPFNGQSALERMLQGRVADLYEVRRYLDAERGGWP